FRLVKEVLQKQKVKDKVQDSSTGHSRTSPYRNFSSLWYFFLQLVDRYEASMSNRSRVTHALKPPCQAQGTFPIPVEFSRRGKKKERTLSSLWGSFQALVFQPTLFLPFFPVNLQAHLLYPNWKSQLILLQERLCHRGTHGIKVFMDDMKL